ncbi:MAG: HD domain-containing protein [Lachnospiraceae bacterium]|nr:HD domain-containing protein [Lachnospiraceae bacterium]
MNRSGSRRKKSDLHAANLLRKHGEDILRSEGFRRSAGHMQHGDVSVMKHSIRVAKTAIDLSHKLGIQVSERDLVRGALLHDYFGYDWHGKKVGLYEIIHFYKMHGFTHPGTALKNAERDFDLNNRQRDIIKKHMWPLTIKPPACREAWIVTMADKYCSLMETLRIHH